MKYWIHGQLGQLFETATGSTPSKSKKQYYGDDVPLVKPPELQNGPLESAEDSLSDEGAAVARVLPPKSILVSCIGNLGKIGMNTVPVAFNQQINAIKPDYEKAIPEFIFYLTLSPSFSEQLHNLTSGTTVPIVNKSKFNSIRIALPPLPEQKRIVAILDEAFAGIDAAVANTEKNLANARELFESYLNAVFTRKGDGWVEKTLGEVCDLISGQHIDSKIYNTEQKGIGYLTGPADFGVINPTVSKWTEFPKRTALRGDILITVKGSGVGKINLLDHEELAISRQLMAVRAQGAKTEFLYEFLSLQFSYFQSLANGAAIPGISRPDVLNLKLSMPELSEQERIVEIIEEYKAQTQHLEAIYQKKLDNLAELKQSILQKAFAGELTALPEGTLEEAIP